MSTARVAVLGVRGGEEAALCRLGGEFVQGLEGETGSI